MNSLVLCSLFFAAASAAPQGWGGASPQAGGYDGGAAQRAPAPMPMPMHHAAPMPQQAAAPSYGGGESRAPAQPQISRQIFVFQAPEQQMIRGPAPIMPAPKLNYNIVVVKTPAHQAGMDAIVAPTAQQKTIVYVLNKKADAQSQKVLEAPSAPAEKPEVYYVSYDDYENQQLPGGIDLQSALRASAEPTQVIQATRSASAAGGNTGILGASAGGDAYSGSASGAAAGGQYPH